MNPPVAFLLLLLLSAAKAVPPEATRGRITPTWALDPPESTDVRRSSRVLDPAESVDVRRPYGALDPPKAMEGRRPVWASDPPKAMDSRTPAGALDPPKSMDGRRPAEAIDGRRPPGALDPPKAIEGRRPAGDLDPPKAMDGKRLPGTLDPPKSMDGRRPPAALDPPKAMDGRRPAGALDPPKAMDGRRPAWALDPSKAMDDRRPAGALDPPKAMDGRRPAWALDPSKAMDGRRQPGTSVSSARDEVYADIRRWNASCAPKDTCRVPRDLDDSQDHNCDCSSLCALYGTCCADSPFLNLSRQHERAAATCRQVAGPAAPAVFVVGACAAGWRGPAALRRRCEQTAKDWSDPFNQVPVTNARSQRTYKSLFCALCNGEEAADLRMWQVLVDCSALNEHMEMCTKNRQFVLDNMAYIREKGLWGIWSWDAKTDWKFRYLPLHFKVPPGLQGLVKECRPRLVADCPPGWPDARTRRLCQAYMAAVYFADTAFRNPHCALCNGVEDFSTMSCHEDRDSGFRKPTMSFGLLLDIDLKHGSQVGNVEQKCGEDAVFDPFAKKCRLLECPLPGFTLKDKKCVPE